MSTTKQRNELEEHIMADRPDINPWVLKVLLDMYCAEGGKDVLQALVKDDMKMKRKGKAPVRPSIPSVMDGVSVSAWDDTWEARSREIADKVGARVLTEEEAAKLREKTLTSV